MSIEGELTTEKDGTGEYAWSATFKTKSIGTFFGHGATEQEAINKVERNIKDLT